MKKSNLFFCATAAMLTLMSLLWFSCQKESASGSPDPAIYFKDITLYSGENSVVLRISSSQEDLLDAGNWAETVELETLKTLPADQPSQEQHANNTELPVGAEVGFEIVRQQLKPDVKGIALHFKNPGSAGAGDRWQWVNTFTTTYDNVKVTTNYGCHDVYYYKRPYSYSNFALMAAFFNRCTTGSWTYAASVPSYQMRSQTYYNNGTSFTITAW